MDKRAVQLLTDIGLGHLCDDDKVFSVLDKEVSHGGPGEGTYIRAIFSISDKPLFSVNKAEVILISEREKYVGERWKYEGGELFIHEGWLSATYLGGSLPRARKLQLPFFAPDDLWDTEPFRKLLFERTDDNGWWKYIGDYKSIRVLKELGL